MGRTRGMDSTFLSIETWWGASEERGVVIGMLSSYQGSIMALVVVETLTIDKKATTNCPTFGFVEAIDSGSDFTQPRHLLRIFSKTHEESQIWLQFQSR